MKNKNRSSSSNEDKENHATRRRVNEAESSNMHISLSSELEGEHQKIGGEKTEENSEATAMLTKGEEEVIMVDNQITIDHDENEVMQKCELLTTTETISQNKPINNADMGKSPMKANIADSTSSLVTDCEAVSPCNKGESNSLYSTSKILEKSIDGFKKLSVDSCSKERNVENADHHMIDLTKEVPSKDKKSEVKKKSTLSGYRSASPKPGRVHKFMKATSKLFSPSKKRDMTPSKPPTQSLTLKSTLNPPKILGKEVLVSKVTASSSPKVQDLSKSVSVSEIAKKFETGTVQKTKSESE